ncbi:MAG: CopG family transcriptional regulator [Clostridia bacterium]|nr:CopG family transcriptional regulator [Clostridia bacterium]
MKQEIRISKKSSHRGDDGHKVVSVRMKDETMARLDELSIETNRSRNELINMLLEAALDIVTIVPEQE